MLVKDSRIIGLPGFPHSNYPQELGLTARFNRLFDIVGTNEVNCQVFWGGHEAFS